MKPLKLLFGLVFACLNLFASNCLAAGTLSASYAPITSNSVVNLSTEGTIDWAHWGLSSTTMDRKASVTPVIENFKPIIIGNAETAHRFDDNYNSYSWTDGAPTAAATNSPTGVYVIGKKSGFQLKVPADTTPRTLKVYVGAFAAKAQFEAALSDNSAPGYSDASIENVGNGPSGVYTINFAAGSPDQMLTVTYTVAAEYDHQYANVTLQAAALSSISSAVAPTKTPAPDTKQASSSPK